MPHLRTVNLIVTCSSRKARQPDSHRLVRNLPKAPIGKRAAHWIEALSTAPQSSWSPAAELYQGEHWSVVRQLIQSRPDEGAWRTRVWIASAGCALISPEMLIPSYGATFSPRDPDSVGRTSVDRRAWWTAVSQNLPAEDSNARSVADVAKRYPEDPILVAASPEYLDAMADDLSSAREALTERILLTILCRRGTLPRALETSKVYLSAQISSTLGGTLSSMNARVLLWLVNSGAESLAQPDVAALISQLVTSSPARPVHNRARATDQEIVSHITQCLGADRQVSGSKALRQFRDAGRAAEQKRFQSLFRAAYEELSNA